MKISFILTAFCIICLSAFLVYSKFEGSAFNTGNISIAVSETDDIYQFKASYDPSSTGRVQRFINKSIEPNGLFKSENDYFDVTTELNDHTNFYIKESPGRLKIELDKRRNSTASYYRIKKMCDGLKDVIAGK